MSWLLVTGAVGVGLGLLAVLVLLASPAPAAELTPAERVTAYVGSASPATATAPTRRPDALTQATGAAAQMLRSNRGLEDRIRHRLEGAGSRLEPAEWLLVHTTVLVLAGLVGLLGTGSLVLFLLFLLLGAAGPWLHLGVRRGRRRHAFSAAVPETLQLMSGSLAAGLSLAQSAETVAHEGVDPIASEFRRALVETRLGVPLEDALDAVAERFDSAELAWAVMAIRIQRQVGGNLAELLDTVAATMREREYVRRQVASLSAEGRLSAWVLGSLPVAFLLYLLVANREYVTPLFEDARGIVMLAGATIWLAVGAFWMSRLVKVEV